jgi:hypothetical protein
MQTSPYRVANRTHDRNSPTLATLSFRPTALKVHRTMVEKPSALRKFLCLLLIEGQRVFGDEVGNLIDYWVGQTAGET